jgi:hypothetical protein
LEVRGWKGELNESSPVPRLETPKPEVPKKYRSVENESFENTKIAEPNESSESPLESKCLLFLLVLVINVEDCS